MKNLPILYAQWIPNVEFSVSFFSFSFGFFRQLSKQIPTIPAKFDKKSAIWIGSNEIC